MGMVNVFVADDHHLVRQGICALLRQQDGVEVVGEAADGRDAVNQIKELNPHIALMDISMPLLDGIQATQKIVEADLDTKVIILSMHSKPNIVKQVLREGAQGYLLKKSIAEELALAIQAAINGHIYLSPQISGAMLDNMLGSNKKGLDLSETHLTPREREVLQLVAEGNTNKETASILSISERTVEKHRANVMKKLDVSDLPTLINEAIKRDLIFVENQPRL
jgi:DNA-binding NarL/FixJ family response regulator